MLPGSLMSMAAAAYLGGRRGDEPAASALFADLAGLPPVIIHVGGDEILLDNSLSITGWLASAGVEAALHVCPGMIHVFPVYSGLTPEADWAIEDVGAFIRRHAA